MYNLKISSSHIKTRTSSAGQYWVIGTVFTLLHEATKKPDKVYITVVLKQWSLSNEGQCFLRYRKQMRWVLWLPSLLSWVSRLRFRKREARWIKAKPLSWRDEAKSPQRPKLEFVFRACEIVAWCLVFYLGRRWLCKDLQCPLEYSAEYWLVHDCGETTHSHGKIP